MDRKFGGGTGSLGEGREGGAQGSDDEGTPRARLGAGVSTK